MVIKFLVNADYFFFFIQKAVFLITARFAPDIQSAVLFFQIAFQPGAVRILPQQAQAFRNRYKTAEIIVNIDVHGIDIFPCRNQGNEIGIYDGGIQL